MNLRSFGGLGLACAVVLGLGCRALAQEEVPMECLRALQTFERSFQIPQGLTTAVSLVETGRQMGGRRLPWPWTINANGQGKFFDTKEQAVAETRKLLEQGQRSIDVGCMQVNLHYHPTAFRTLEEAFDPAINVAYGTKFLASLHTVQGSWEKAVERYHSSDDGRREDYREKVLALWNGDVRTLVMDAVLAENTNTPYHHALNAFAAGHYADALDKYREIVAASPKDRLGLLGIALSYEKLGEEVEADAAYSRYIAADPDDAAIIAIRIKSARSLPPAEARARLESLINAGVSRPEVFAALSEILATGGDNEAAFSFAERALKGAPSIVHYQLNAAILADRLKRPAAAVRYYEDFLASAERQPNLIEAPISGIRDRVQFLRARM